MIKTIEELMEQNKLSDNNPLFKKTNSTKEVITWYPITNTEWPPMSTEAKELCLKEFPPRNDDACYLFQFSDSNNRGLSIALVYHINYVRFELEKAIETFGHPIAWTYYPKGVKHE